jgi:hypothetical protein
MAVAVEVLETDDPGMYSTSKYDPDVDDDPEPTSCPVPNAV